MSCVYIHTNKINGKVYVGKTDNKPEFRWNGGKGYRSCPLFYHAIKKYSWDGFTHEVVLDGLTKEQAVAFEKMLIAKYDSTNRKKGYNIVDGGSVSSGLMGGLATAKKLRRPVCQYDVDGNLLNVYPGVNVAAQILLNKKRSSAISQVCNGIGGTAHGYVWRYQGDSFDKYDVNAKSQKTRVDQYDLDGNHIKRYSCLTDAENESGAAHGDILRCCKGQRHTAGGFIWRYVDG